ncbi:MAG: efflux RND transporter periplasmic adaptor subunit [Candidatus Pacebacteria bacterium]|nr:efflux RND transporter periplasmic adaptor subunit [Candidatus Paceibacterota bacterium]
MISKLFRKIKERKIIVIIIILIVALVGYFGYQKLFKKQNNKEQYITTKVEKGDLAISVSGSGQIVVSDQIDIKPKTSGEITYVNVEKNQEVKNGVLLFQLDTRDAQKAVKDAELNLKNAETSQDIVQKTEESLESACNSALDNLTNAFTSLFAMKPDLKNMFLESSQGNNTNDIDYYLHLVNFYLDSYGSDLGFLTFWGNDLNNIAEEKYNVIQKELDSLWEKYSALSYDSSCVDIEIIINQTYDIVRSLLDLVRQSSNVTKQYHVIVEKEHLISPISTVISETHASNLTEFTSSLSSLMNNLSSAKQSLKETKEAMANIGLEVETQNNTISKLEYALADAKENLAQHYIYSPFKGAITGVNVKKGDTVSSGTTLATIITQEKIAKISLNEIDAAKIKIGQKAVLSFDALSGLSISGQVIDLDIEGTVSQGVVSYGVTIAFDDEEAQVKPGMSVSVEIITDSRQGVLILPNSAINYRGDNPYVNLSVSGEIKQQMVELGLSSDTHTEIISGIEQGDLVITTTIISNKAAVGSTSNNNQNQRFQMMPGMTGMMGGDTTGRPTRGF